MALQSTSPHVIDRIHPQASSTPIPFHPYDRHASQEEQSVQLQKKPTPLVHWCPPSPGYLKLNTDGSSLGNPGPSSYGGLIRNDSGDWVCGYVGKIKGVNTSLDAEIRGILMGLHLVRAMQFKKVVIETDCQAALLLITVGSIDNTHPQISMINECRKHLKELCCYMVHVRRDGNHCADQMAKIGGRQEREFVFVDDPPPMLIPFLQADTNGG